MTGYRELLEKEVIEAWRTYRLAIIVGLFVMLGILSPVVTRFLPDIIRTFAPPDFVIDLPELGLPEVIDQLLKNVLQFGALAAILVTMGTVAGERERGTAALILAKPVSRAAFLWAKFVALAMVFGLGVGLAIGGAWLYTAVLFEAPAPVPWMALGAVIWLSTMVYVSITFLGSTLADTPLGGAAIGFAGLILLSLASIAPPLTTWLPAGLLGVAKAVALESVGPDLDPPRTISISVGIIGGCLLLAWLRFRRREL